MKIDLYSDGSAQTKATNGGWGWVMVIDGIKYSEGSGHEKNVTNNDMELAGAIQGLAEVLKFVNRSREANAETSQVDFDVTLCSDSQIVLGWADGSFRFKQEEKMEKFKQLQFLVKRLNIKTRWVKGHSGDPNNSRCDRLANLARKQIKEAASDQVENKTQSSIGTKRTHVVSLWYSGVLKVIDFETGIIENYSRDAHGKRGSVLEIREAKER